MRHKPMNIQDSYLLQTPVHQDNRGQFEVFWEEHLLNEVGIKFNPSNAHHSYNSVAGTLRGMHFQQTPHGQSKLVSCVSGSVWDVLVDLRSESTTYKQWGAQRLDAASGKAIYIPAGCAHGFLTLTDNATIAYLIEGDYQPGSGRVLRWDDEDIGIEWPIKTEIISETDKNAPRWDQCEF